MHSEGFTFPPGVPASGHWLRALACFKKARAGRRKTKAEELPEWGAGPGTKGHEVGVHVARTWTACMYTPHGSLHVH